MISNSSTYIKLEYKKKEDKAEKTPKYRGPPNPKFDKGQKWKTTKCSTNTKQNKHKETHVRVYYNQTAENQIKCTY